MGVEMGILKSADEPTWVSRPEHDLPLESWRGLHTPQSWIKNGVVWYSQELCQILGVDTIQSYLNQWGYGNFDISEDAMENEVLKQFWLNSSLQVSVKEQVLLIHKFLDGQFDAKFKTLRVLEDLFYLE